MLKKILLALVAVIAVILIAAAFQPSTYHIERSLAINAAPAEIFPHLNDFKKAQVWSPWVKLDPAAKYTFDGPASGVGASNSWSGNSDVGSGRQTIVAVRPNESVQLKLEFFTPMEGVCRAEFRLKPAAGSTTVTWSMDGDNNYLSKIMCLFMSMDKMIGGPFEEGLGNLKKVVESAAKK